MAGDERVIELRLDAADYDAVQKAMAYRQSWLVMPDADGGNVAGQVIAEICRGWLEGKGMWP